MNVNEISKRNTCEIIAIVRELDDRIVTRGGFAWYVDRGDGVRTDVLAAAAVVDRLYGTDKPATADDTTRILGRLRRFRHMGYGRLSITPELAEDGWKKVDYLSIGEAVDIQTAPEDITIENFLCRRKTPGNIKNSELLARIKELESRLGVAH